MPAVTPPTYVTPRLSNAGPGWRALKFRLPAEPAAFVAGSAPPKVTVGIVPVLIGAAKSTTAAV